MSKLGDVYVRQFATVSDLRLFEFCRLLIAAINQYTHFTAHAPNSTELKINIGRSWGMSVAVANLSSGREYMPDRSDSILPMIELDLELREEDLGEIVKAVKAAGNEYVAIQQSEGTPLGINLNILNPH